MKMQEKRDLLKRVAPLILAGIILAGAVFGTIGSVMAMATDSSGDDIEISKSYDVKMTHRPEFKRYEDEILVDVGPEVEEKTSYYVRLRVQIHDKEWDPLLRPTIELKDGDFEDISDNKEHSPIDGNPVAIKGTGNNQNDIVGYIYTYSDIHVRTSSKPASEDSFRLNLYIMESSAKLNEETGINVTNKRFVNSNSSDDNDKNDYGADRNDSSTSSSEAEVLTTPKMIITNFNIPDIVEYGEDFRVSIEFLNNSRIKNMENVSMTVTPSEGVAIKNGVNKRHYVTVPKRQSTSEIFTLKASEKLAAEAITLTIKWDYQYKVDGAYKDGTSEEAVTITAVPKPEESSSSEDEKGTEGAISSFDILSVIPPEDVYPEEPAYVTVKVINKDHQFDASNVQLTITGEGLVNSGNTEYHGALAHSSQAEIETEVTFKTPGTYNLLATVVYEDSVGKDEDKKPIVRINDLQKEFTVVVKESPAMDGMGMGMGMDGAMMQEAGMTPGMSGFDEDGMPVGGSPVATVIGWVKSHLALSIGGGAALIALVIVIVVVVKKKKAEQDEDI